MKYLGIHSIMAGALATLLATHSASASVVTPTSYTFDQAASCGTWCYYDPTFTKLTDGVLGNSGWAHNSGNEWVGWYNKSTVNIDFTFAAASAIDSVTVFTAQDNLGDVVFPSFKIYSSNDGVNWSLAGGLNIPADSANDHDAYSSDAPSSFTIGHLGIDALYVRVAALENGPWTFASEVTFAGTAAPELSTWGMMLLGFAGMGFAGYRASRKRVA